MRVVFFGTPTFAAQILKFLIEQNVNIVGVVSRPDKPQGRSRQLSPTPVKSYVETHFASIPLFQPVRASSEAFIQTLKELEPDLFIVVAYGEILKQPLLDVPRLMPINVHASLLPKYRGAAPMQRALMAGDQIGGVTIMEMVLEMDAGDMLHVEKTAIPIEMNLEEYSKKLCQLSCHALMKVIHDFEANQVKKTPQDSSQVTFAPKITPEDGHIDWSQSAVDIHNRIRALAPRPGAYTFARQNEGKKRIKILKTSPVEGLKGAPREILSFDRRMIVACGSGALEILELQPEGKKAMSAQEFIRGSAAPDFI